MGLYIEMEVSIITHFLETMVLTSIPAQIKTDIAPVYEKITHYNIKYVSFFEQTKILVIKSISDSLFIMANCP